MLFAVRRQSSPSRSISLFEADRARRAIATYADEYRRALEAAARAERLRSDLIKAATLLKDETCGSR